MTGEQAPQGLNLSTEPTPVLQPRPEDVAEVGKLRMRELMDIRDRLDSLPKMPWSRLWGGLATLLLGAAIGGALAGWQLTPDTDRFAYWAIVIAVFVGGCLCALAALTTHTERADSVQTIKESLDRLLPDYETDEP